MRAPLQPILVMMSYRGGARLARCLDSIETAQHHFSRIILSVTAPEDSDDMQQCLQFHRDRVPRAEVICTGTELPTMEHQAFWVTHLERTGATKDDWIFWLAYDDQVRTRGIESLVDGGGNWPLDHGTAYFGPWAMRHEQADSLWDGDPTEPLECWTSFPLAGPTRLPVLEWIRQQLIQPTYMQMSGSIAPLESFIALRDRRPRKKGPMRIEMAIASAPPNTHVEELPEPVTIIYGRSNSDRANYGRAARREDAHLGVWLMRYAGSHPSEWADSTRLAVDAAGTQVRTLLRRHTAPSEEWRCRGTVVP